MQCCARKEKSDAYKYKMDLWSAHPTINRISRLSTDSHQHPQSHLTSSHPPPLTTAPPAAMSEKHTYGASHHPSTLLTPAPASTNGGWHPTHAPADTTRMGHQAPPGYGSQPMQPMQPMQQQVPHGGQPMKQQFVSAEICPVTGGPHQEKSRPGAIGLIIGILFCPIGCIA